MREGKRSSVIIYRLFYPILKTVTRSPCAFSLMRWRLILQKAFTGLIYFIQHIYIQPYGWCTHAHEWVCARVAWTQSAVNINIEQCVVAPKPRHTRTQMRINISAVCMCLCWNTPITWSFAHIYRTRMCRTFERGGRSELMNTECRDDYMVSLCALLYKQNAYTNYKTRLNGIRSMYMFWGVAFSSINNPRRLYETLIKSRIHRCDASWLYKSCAPAQWDRFNWPLRAYVLIWAQASQVD